MHHLLDLLLSLLTIPGHDSSFRHRTGCKESAQQSLLGFERRVEVPTLTCLLLNFDFAVHTHHPPFTPKALRKLAGGKRRRRATTGMPR
jgi:hypothetical protein